MLLPKHRLVSKEATTPKPNMQTLSRDKEIFGNRPVTINQNIPDIDPYQRRNEPSKAPDIQNIPRMIENRDIETFGPQPPKPDATKLEPGNKDTAEDNESFMKKLKELETQRRDLLDASLPSEMNERLKIDQETHQMLATNKHDPKALFMANLPKHIDEPPAASTQKELTVNPRTIQRRILEKYINVSSQDRIEDDLYRYQYGVFLLTKYRNINSITIGKVVIPDDIIQTTTSKPNFNYDFSLSFPYLLLQIDEFTDVYDGTSDMIRKSFCKLVFHKSYRSQNGRGYIVLKPEQKERKYFYPAPLSVINKLSINIVKPNGKLLNYSKDNYSILSITYDSSHPNYYKITTDIYYDINEFFAGDMILIKNFIMTQTSLLQSDLNIKQFNIFMNKKEGHDILLGGVANAAGYYNTFYIQAIGAFDSSVGSFVLLF